MLELTNIPELQFTTCAHVLEVLALGQRDSAWIDATEGEVASMRVYGEELKPCHAVIVEVAVDAVQIFELEP